ncbi:MAG TPA: ABC transporter permease [Candidatus Acidoferrales bacterium]|nr:ABC transporter permease [Candidatus Acidoferrales bacterium]
MKTLRSWLLRFGGLFGKSRRDRELAAEIESNLALHIEDNLRAGMTPAEARRQALLKFGGIESTKESYRDRSGIPVLETIWQDIRFAIRMLRKSPGFTAVVVITLALGIGANTAIFSIVDTLMLRPLPVHDPHQLVFLSFPRDATHFDASFSTPEFRQVRDATRGIFSDVNAMVLGGLSGAQGRSDGLTVDRITRPAQTAFVTGNFFQMLGIRPYLGRFILPSEEDAAGADPVVVLSYRYWKSRFDGDPGILNKPAWVNGHAVTIVGIGPKEFLGLTPIVEMQAYLPLGMMTLETGENTEFLSNPAARGLLIVARLVPGETLAHANAALAALGPQLAKEYPRPGESTALQARALRPPGLIDGPNPLPALAGLFFTLSGLVLGLACLNVANLSLVRASGRTREMAVRAALGGSRVRLVRQLLSEMMLLGLLGAAAGIIAAVAALRAISSLVTVTELPLVFEFPLHVGILIYALSLAFLAAAVIGIVPALRASSGKVSDVLHEGGRTSTGRSQRTRMALVAAQVAGALALLIVAGLFTRSLVKAQHSDLGFNPRNVLNVKLDPGEIGYTQTQAKQFYDRLLLRTRALPGVEWASLAMSVPLDNFQSEEIAVQGYTPRRGEQLHADYNAVSPDYFKTMRLAILQGRGLRDSDNESAPRVALVDQAMAERFWRGENPIGHTFTTNRDPRHAIEIVGVVRNSRNEDTYSPYSPTFYVPIAQGFTPAETLQIRTAGPPEAIAPQALAIERELAPTAPILNVQTMSEEIDGPDGLAVFNWGAELTGALGLLGFMLAVIGIYGVMAYAVAQRTQEIGVRMALGAQQRNILWMISRQGLTIIAIGLPVGIAIAATVGHLVADFLIGVGPTDSVTYATVTLLLASVALAACYIPARRAMRVDPMTALRHE